MGADVITAISKLSPFIGAGVILILFCSFGLPPILKWYNERLDKKHGFELKKQSAEHELKQRDDEIMLALVKSTETTTVILASLKEKVDDTYETVNNLQTKNDEYETYRKELKESLTELKTSIVKSVTQCGAAEMKEFIKEVIKRLNDIENKIIIIGGKVDG